MYRFEHIPQRSSYSIGVPDDVITASLGAMPVDQRLNTTLNYTANLAFILNGVDLDIFLEAYRLNDARKVEMNLMLDDSKLRYYVCYFATAPSITPLGGDMGNVTAAQINTGTIDTSKYYYEVLVTVYAESQKTFSEDFETLAAYELENTEMFNGYIIADEGA